VAIDTAFGFEDGVAVSLVGAAEASGAIAPAAVAASYAGAFNQAFVVNGADIPPILRTLVRIRAVTETITLGVSITVTNPTAADFPAALTVSEASMSGLQVYRGTSRVAGPLSFSGIEDESIVYEGVADCTAVTSCTYAAAVLVDLLELRVSGRTASNLAKAIADGGTFRVEGTFGIVIESDPGLPADATVQAVIVGTGAVVE